MARALVHAHPGLGDHAEDPLGADQHPVGARPGARAGQPAALPGAGRGDRPHRLDQVVDVGPDGREVPPGPGRDPAAEGRVLERLREVAQGQPVLGELLVERRAEHPGLDPRRPRDRVDLEHPVERAEVDRHRARVVVADPRLDPADDAGAAAVGDRRGAGVGAPREHRLDLGLVARAGDEVGRVLEPAAKAADDVAVGLAERVRDALAAVVGDDLGQRGRRLQPRRGQLDRSSGTGSSASPPNPSRSRTSPARGPQVGGRGLLVCVAPAPVLARPPQRELGCLPVHPAHQVREQDLLAVGLLVGGLRGCRRRPRRPPSSCRPWRRSSRGTGGRRC